jgi:hypothetical protein
MFGSGSFFEKRSPAVAATVPVGESAAGAPHTTAALAPAAAPPAEGEQLDPLARFKKMPNLLKRH